MDIPIFLFTGFLESGKSTFITDTLNDPEFSRGQKILLVLCEEGEVEFDEVALARKNVFIERVEEETDLSGDLLKKWNSQYRPSQVMIEYNGMWKMDSIMDLPLPKKWMLAQVLTTIDATTFQTYIGNMKSMVMEHVTYSDLIVINRCRPDEDQTMYKRNIKAVNRRAQFIFEGKDGNILEPQPEELPYDLSRDELTIEPEDFGIWYLDAMDYPEKYDGKTVHFLGIVYKNRELPRDSFVAGRFAMTCCAEDIAFIGMIANYEFADRLKTRDWVQVTAKVRKKYERLYQGEGAVLDIVDIRRGEKPAGDDLVYFS